MPFTVTEPHPTVRAHTYTHSGRGGAGNTFRAPVTTPAEGIPTLAKVNSAGSSVYQSNRFYAGRGGAGNVYPVSERRELSLDDEYAYAAAVANKSTAGHVGRGGAGNVFFSLKKTSDNTANRKASDASTSSTSSSSGSIKSGFWGRLHRH